MKSLRSYLAPESGETAGRNHPSPKQPAHQQMLKVKWHFYRKNTDPPSGPITSPQHGTAVDFSSHLDRSLDKFKGTQFLQTVNIFKSMELTFSSKANSLSTTSRICRHFTIPKIYLSGTVIYYPYPELDGPNQRPKNQY
jgi:hypothetical protein